MFLVCLTLALAGRADAAVVATWVAMGDSYSSGEGAPPFLSGTDVSHGDQCHRSTRSYAEDLRGSAGFPSNLVFVACSGAKIANFYPGKGQKGETRGQLTDLSPSTSLVSMTVGGNDVEFKDLITSCVALPACELTDNLATRLLISHTLPRLKALYQAVLAVAPSAQVYVLGYPHFFSPHPSVLCNGVDDAEAHWISRMEDLLNAGIAKQISDLHSPRLHYVDTTNAFDGGELCSAKHPIYMNGLIKTHLVYSFHPTVAGQARLASILASAVRGPAPPQAPPQAPLGVRCGYFNVPPGNGVQAGQYGTYVLHGKVTCTEASSVLQAITTGKGRNVDNGFSYNSYSLYDGWTCPSGQMGVQLCQPGTKAPLPQPSSEILSLVCAAGNGEQGCPYKPVGFEDV